MNEILNTRLFALLSEPSQEVKNHEMQRTYGDFVEHIQAVSSSDDKANMAEMPVTDEIPSGQ